MEHTQSRLEKLAERCAKTATEYRISLWSSWLFGLAAYMFVFTNKLLNLDELAGLFGKGETVSSGRWGLSLTSLIFPDYSMPWINGLICILLLSVSICLIIGIFEIKKPILQVLLSGLIIAFPSQAVTFAYMFTCAPYALAVLFAVWSVYLTLKGGRGRYVCSIILLCLSAAIYQAYISVTVSLYVVFYIRQTLKNADIKGIIRGGLRCILAVVLSLALYFAVNKAVMHFAAVEYNSYATAAWNSDIRSILSGIRVAFTAFFGYFLKGHYHLAPTVFSMAVHTLLAVVIAVPVIAWGIKCRDNARKILLLALIIVFPLSVNCIYIISSQRHTLMLLSFTSVYVLAACLLEELDFKRLRSAALVCMGLILVCNIFYSNRLYLKMKLEYEEAYGFYSSLVSRVKSAEGYDNDTMLIITGDANELVYHADEIDTSDIVGLMEGLLNIYSRYDFLRYYIGYDYRPIDWDGWGALNASDEVEKMPVFPYDGSVKKFGDYMVVKLG